MKYLMLVWSGLGRKRVRTVLTMLSIVVAFLLFGLLQGINKGFDTAVDSDNAHRLVTQNKYSMVDGMPLSHAKRIAAVPGVTAVSYLAYFGGYYQDSRNSIGVFAADVPVLFQLYKEFKIPKEQVEAMRTRRTGALINRSLAATYGWKIGDRVPVGTSIWTRKQGGNDYYFDIVGIFDSTSLGAAGRNSFYINYDYFDEARQFGNGKVHFFLVGIDQPARADEISKQIDEAFENSSYETKTQTEQSYLGGQIKQVADINLIADCVVGAVIFTLLFLTGNTMMQSLRERISELAVLKTLGFTDRKVSLLVLSESLLLCLVSSAMGMLLARLAFVPLGRTLGSIEFKPSVSYAALLVAIVLVLVSGLPPALRARRLSIVDALARRR